MQGTSKTSRPRLELLLQPNLQRFSYTGVWTNMSSYPNKQPHKAVGKVVYPPQTKTRMKGQKGKAAREEPFPQSPAISTEKVQGGKKKKSLFRLSLWPQSSSFSFSYDKPHYAGLYIQMSSLHQTKVRVETEFKHLRKEQKQPTHSHLGTLIQFAGFREVKLFFTGLRRMKGALW